MSNTSTKLDFKRTLKHLYTPSKKAFSVVEVPTMNFLMIDGKGDLSSNSFYQDASEALYATSYKLKFMSKTTLDKDYVVPPLEGLWWADDIRSFTTKRDKSKWHWTMMIMVPEWLTAPLVDQAKVQAAAKKALPALPKVRFEAYDEGLCAQIMHVGSYEDEGPILAELHNTWLPEHGYSEAGTHHEIYLSDPRRVAPEKLKTVLRQPIQTLANPA
ncbi:MAG: GyrI-like domain-containing protein [Deinococcota bacterium]